MFWNKNISCSTSLGLSDENKNSQYNYCKNFSNIDFLLHMILSYVHNQMFSLKLSTEICIYIYIFPVHTTEITVKICKYVLKENFYVYKSFYCKVNMTFFKYL